MSRPADLHAFGPHGYGAAVPVAVAHDGAALYLRALNGSPLRGLYHRQVVDLPLLGGGLVAAHVADPVTGRVLPVAPLLDDGRAVLDAVDADPLPAPEPEPEPEPEPTAPDDEPDDEPDGEPDDEPDGEPDDEPDNDDAEAEAEALPSDR